MKRISLTIVMMLVIGVCCSCSDLNLNGKTIEDIPVICDFVKQDYEELKTDAKIIAKVEVLDDLSEDSGIVEKSGESILSFVSKRSIRVLEYYKNTPNQEATEMVVLENAAIIDSKYFHPEGCDTLKKGKIYILFMSDETASGLFSIMNGIDGMIDLKDFDKSGDDEIAVKSLIEFESTLDKSEKKQLLNSDLTLQADLDKSEDKAQIVIKEKDGVSDLQIVYEQIKPGHYAVEVIQ